MTKYDRLLDSSLPIKWTVIRAAFLGGLITAAQVQNYAADQLGKDSGQKGDLVLRLFDAETNPSDELSRLLSELADAEDQKGDAQNQAERICNLIALAEWLEPYPTEPRSDELSEWIDGITNPEFHVPYGAAFGFQFDPDIFKGKGSHDYWNASQAYYTLSKTDHEAEMREYYSRFLRSVREWIRREGAELAVLVMPSQACLHPG